MRHWAARGRPVQHPGKAEACDHVDCGGGGTPVQVPRAGETCGIVIASGAQDSRTGLRGEWKCGRTIGHPGAHRRFW